jgi:hypothetical protein
MHSFHESPTTVENNPPPSKLFGSQFLAPDASAFPLLQAGWRGARRAGGWVGAKWKLRGLHQDVVWVMTKSRSGLPEILEQSRPLQVGFIPDTDCAPLVAARESGLFDKYELRVQLRRETRWANIRDKVIYGELDAAHAPATLPFITNLAIESDHCACVAGMVLSLQGNAITVSSELRDAGVRDAATLRELVYRNWGRRTYTFGIVFPHSPA